MALHGQDMIDILQDELRAARIRAEVWTGIVEYLENELEKEFNGPVGLDFGVATDGSNVVVGGTVSREYLGEGGQGDDLPRDEQRDEPIRYYRGSPESDSGPL